MHRATCHSSPSLLVRKRQAGLTFIELILTLVVLGILATISLQMIEDSHDTAVMLNANQATSARVRNALERMEREIRETRRTGSSYDIATFTGTKLEFTKIDGSTVVICNGTSPVCAGGGKLTLESNGSAASDLIDQGISNANPLTYYRLESYTDPSDGLTKTRPTSTGVDATNIRFVDIHLTVEDTDVDSGQRRFQANTRVALRIEG